MLLLDLSTLRMPVLHSDLSNTVPELHLDLSALQSPVLHLDGFPLQGTELHGDVSAQQ